MKNASGITSRFLKFKGTFTRLGKEITYKHAVDISDYNNQGCGWSTAVTNILPNDKVTKFDIFVIDNGYVPHPKLYKRKL